MLTCAQEQYLRRATKRGGRRGSRLHTESISPTAPSEVLSLVLVFLQADSSNVMYIHVNARSFHIIAVDALMDSHVIYIFYRSASELLFSFMVHLKVRPIFHRSDEHFQVQSESTTVVRSSNICLDQCSTHLTDCSGVCRDT